MDSSTHLIVDLFLQLGLPSSSEQIEKFIKVHRGIPSGIRLFEASFWSEPQASFIQEAIEQDSDWVETVDHLDVLLRNN
jgi:hypothetical protein